MMQGYTGQSYEQWATHPGVLAFIHAGHILGEGWGSWVDWGIVVSLVISAAILALIVCARIFYPRRVIHGRALFLNAVALVILPVMLLPFATFTTFEYAKQINFCGSCHLAMEPYVHDLVNPKGKSLAALHYQVHFTPTQPGTACYSCHATYGVHGTMIAKMQGLSDAYRYTTGLYTTPIKLRKPFSNTLCLKCHIESSIFRSQRIHMDKDGNVSPLMLNSTISCEMCHPSGHMIGASE
jgi:hypothetical protein